MQIGIGDDVLVKRRSKYDGKTNEYEGYVVGITNKKYIVQVIGKSEWYDKGTVRLLKKAPELKYIDGTDVRLGDTVKNTSNWIGRVYLITNFGVVVNFGEPISVWSEKDLIFVGRGEWKNRHNIRQGSVKSSVGMNSLSKIS